MSEQTISVIVPVHKVEEYLEECVRSLLGQTFPDLEILLVDDGSPDGCPQLCDRLAEEDPRIRVLHQENGGQSAARNAGLDAAKGRYILFLDGDDTALPDMCETLYGLMRTADAEIAAGGFLEDYGNRKVSWKTYPEVRIFSGSEALSEVLKGEAISGFVWGKLFRRELFENCRFPEGQIYEDLYIAPDLYLQAKRVAAVSKPVCVYRHRAGSAMSEGYNPRSMDAVTSCEAVLEKVKRNAPERLPEARFRLDWAYFMVFDRMLAVKDPASLPEYGRVRDYLKANWRSIAGCPYFQKTRRFAAAALKAGVPFYRILWRMQQKKTAPG